MKKALTILLCLAVSAGFFACGQDEAAEKTYTYEIAMITPSSAVSIDDGANVENTWEGVRAFAEETGKTYKYYEPEEETEEAALKAIESAVSADSKVIVGYGSAMGKIFDQAAEKYSDQAFLLVDGVFHTTKPKISLGMEFDHAAAGYLAGYAAVTEGYETVGYLAEDSSEESKDYGYGFMQGCQAAAAQWGHFVDMRVSYDGTKVQQTAKAWYEEGTEMIAVYGDAVFTKTAAAEAEKLNRPVFASGFSAPDEIVTASAVLDCRRAAEELLETACGPATDKHVMTFVGTDYIRLDWSEEAFGLFLQEDYDRILEKMKAEGFNLKRSTDAKSEKDLIRKANLYKISLL